MRLLGHLASTVTAGVLVLCGQSVFAQAVRQLPPHVHGQSHLGIVAEDKNLSMELHAPGNDIVGFEFVPSTDTQRAAVAAATAMLKDPLTLFGVPAPAQCTVQKSDVVLAEEDESEADQAPGAGAAAPPLPAAPATPADRAAPRHSEFQVTYELSCGNVAAITGLNFAFFQKFPNAQQVNVDIVGSRGAFSFVVLRANPNTSTRNMF